MVPQPCLAVTLLFQCSPNLQKFKDDQRTKGELGGQTVSPDLVYLKQYVCNACGTIASIHSLANNAATMKINPDSPIGRFLHSIQGKSPEEAGTLLADAVELHQASDCSAQSGQTNAPEASASVDCHFVAFVEKGGDVYELDGTKQFPINHGNSDGNFLKAAASVIRACFMDQDPENLHFNMMALVKSP